MKQKLLTALLLLSLCIPGTVLGESKQENKVAVPDLWAGINAEDWSIAVSNDTEEIVAEQNYFDEVTESSSVVEEVWKYPNENIDLFASIIYYEAGCLSRECKLLVGSVIINRMESNEYDWKNLHSIEDVVSQHRTKNGKTRYQYSTYKRAKRTLKTNKSSYEVAEWLLKNGSYDTKPTFQHYKVKVKGTKEYKKVDTEVFSYYE